MTPTPPASPQSTPGLSSKQRKTLRGMAHELKPIVQIGKSGLTESLMANLEEALEHHELLKVKFGDLKEHKKELSATICERLKCEVVGMIGHTVILFRRARDPEHRHIRIPKA